MKSRQYLIVMPLLATGLLCGAARAADPQLDVPSPPPIPAEGAVSSNAPEPEVRIIEKGDATVTEYRLHGHLYKIKVTPKVGKPYYLIDNTGKGSFTRIDELGSPELVVPQWVLFEF